MNIMDNAMDRDVLRDKIDEWIKINAYDQIKNALMEYDDISSHDNDLATVYYLMRICEMERDAGQRTILEKAGSLNALLERYTILKFYLRRIDFGIIGEDLQDFYQYVVHNQVSAYEFLTVMNYSVVHKQEVLEIIRDILQEIA